MSWLVVTLAIVVVGPADAQQDGVRIHVEIQASDYTYWVGNVASRPITRFEVAQSNAYLFRAPDGWQVESKDGLFVAWTDDVRHAIRRRGTGKFSLRVTSKGAVLGEVQARLGLKSGESIVIDDLWGIVPEPRSTVLLVSGVMAALMLFHAGFMALLDRRAACSEPTAP